MGLHTTRNIVTSLGVISNLKSGRGSGLDISGLWHHSAGVAGAAKVLSKHVGVEEERPLHPVYCTISENGI
ncbi:HDOD domain-containing protein [Candidatus Reidiella endopervernicosa]|uniref:HDOD domain-containing protein n=1 Tax=Candidatus Reidiella endopervernicosa TaxID=2738883 RepID=A0A6N0HYB9_9GAMM|nr:HDOD domain-containing protein [Candidatus Reidiella endopervernicosa]